MAGLIPPWARIRLRSQIWSARSSWDHNLPARSVPSPAAGGAAGPRGSPKLSEPEMLKCLMAIELFDVAGDFIQSTAAPPVLFHKRSGN